MAELVDAVVLEATTSVWEFESPLGHQSLCYETILQRPKNRQTMGK
jgi:hypothetical protein